MSSSIAFLEFPGRKTPLFCKGSKDLDTAENYPGLTEKLYSFHKKWTGILNEDNSLTPAHTQKQTGIF